MHIDGINHITLKARDLDVAEEFYTRVLGLKRVGHRKHMRFYSTGRYAHELALLHDPDYSPNANEGMAHFCFNVSSEVSLRALYQHCKDMGQSTSELINHTVMHSFYLESPDGHHIEIGLDRPADEWAGNPQPFARDSLLEG